MHGIRLEVTVKISPRSAGRGDVSEPTLILLQQVIVCLNKSEMAKIIGRAWIYVNRWYTGKNRETPGKCELSTESFILFLL